jgi:hypothetical protein
MNYNLERAGQHGRRDILVKTCPKIEKKKKASGCNKLANSRSFSRPSFCCVFAQWQRIKYVATI